MLSLCKLYAYFRIVPYLCYYKVNWYECRIGTLLPIYYLKALFESFRPIIAGRKILFY